MKNDDNEIKDNIYNTIIKILNLFITNYEEKIYDDTFIYLDSNKKIINFLKSTGFEGEEKKISQIDDYDNHNKFYEQILKNFNFNLSNLKMNIFKNFKYLKLYFIIPIIKIILKIIENKKNLELDIIKLYINNIFDFFINKDLNSLSNDFTFYKGIKYKLKFYFSMEKEKFDFVNQLNKNKYSNSIINYKKLLLNINYNLKNLCMFLIKILENKKREEENIENKNKIIISELYEISLKLNKNDSIFNNFGINCSKTYEQILKENEIFSTLNYFSDICNKINKYKENINELNSFIEKIKNFKYNKLYKIFLIFRETETFEFFDEYIFEFNKIIKIYNNFISSFHKDNQFNKLLKEILHDENFKNLYCEIMQSEIIKEFVSIKKILYNNLDEYYEEFIKELKKDKDKFFSYIKLETLSLYKKAFVDHFLRIFINDNFIYKSDNLKEEDIKEILKAYLIEVLIHESFHFIRRFKNLGKLTKEVYSPMSKDTNSNEIGKDLIYYIFKVTNIIKLNINQALIINNIKNWNEKNNFENLFNEENNENEDNQNCLRFMDIKPIKEKFISYDVRY